MTENRKIRVGIIGTGGIAKAHMQAYLRCPDVEVVAMADLVPGRVEAFCEVMNVPVPHVYPDHKSLIDNEELDAVSVCTYNRTHAECTIYALEHGVNVLCEKPMSVTLDEAIEMRKAEKKSGKVLSIGFQPRFDANMQMIKKIVQSGVLGKIYYMQSGGGRRHGIPAGGKGDARFNTTSFIEDRTAGIGAMADIGCYSLDMLMNAVGYPKPLTVTGYKSDFFGKNPDYYPTAPECAKVFSVDDFAAGFIRLEGDIILDFRISWAMHMDTAGDALILGTKGGLRIPSTECWNGSIGGPLVLYHDVAGQQTQTVIPPAKVDEKALKNHDLFYQKVRSFLDASMTGGKAPVPTEEIIYNQAIIDGIVRSANCGHEIELEIPD